MIHTYILSLRSMRGKTLLHNVDHSPGVDTIITSARHWSVMCGVLLRGAHPGLY